MRRSSTIIRAAILISAVLLLEILCQTGVISYLQLTAPSRMATTLFGLMGESNFWFQTTKTIRNIFIAIIAATLLGFLIGLLLYRLPRLRRALEPIIASYYALPFFVLYPLAIVLVGMNDFSIILMGFAYALVAMITNTLSGLDRRGATYVLPEDWDQRRPTFESMAQQIVDRVQGSTGVTIPLPAAEIRDASWLTTPELSGIFGIGTANWGNHLGTADFEWSTTLASSTLWRNNQ